jgi:hypothetical protein
MLDLEIKILILTAAYFLGWFLFEKVFRTAWERFQPEPATGSLRRAARPLPPLAGVAPLDQTWRYIKGLKNPDWRIRRISCIQLGSKRGTAVVQALIESLDDPREEVSLAAGEALAQIGDPTAITALTDHLHRLENRTEQSYERYKAA